MLYVYGRNRRGSRWGGELKHAQGDLNVRMKKEINHVPISDIAPFIDMRRSRGSENLKITRPQRWR